MTCLLTSGGLEVTANSYVWNTEHCYTNGAYRNGNPYCFPNGRTTKRVSEVDLTAEDAGTITCNATIGSTTCVSNPVTIRIRGQNYYDA